MEIVFRHTCLLEIKQLRYYLHEPVSILYGHTEELSAALAEPFVGCNVLQRPQDECQRSADIVCRVDEEVYLLLVIALLQAVAVVVPSHVNEPYDERRVHHPCPDSVPPRLRNGYFQCGRTENPPTAHACTAQVQLVVSGRKIGISDLLLTPERTPLLVEPLEQTLVLDVVLIAVVDTFEVNSDGILVVTQSYVALFQHVVEILVPQAILVDTLNSYSRDSQRGLIDDAYSLTRIDDYCSLTASEHETTVSGCRCRQPLIFALQTLHVVYVRDNATFHTSQPPVGTHPEVVAAIVDERRYHVGGQSVGCRHVAHCSPPQVVTVDAAPVGAYP